MSLYFKELQIYGKKRKRYKVAITTIKDKRSAEFRFRYRVQRPFKYVIGPVARILYSLIRIVLIFIYLNV